MQEVTRSDKEQVQKLQSAMTALPQFDGVRTNHFFANGMYARTVWRPAGVLTVGKLHKHEHFSILLSGEVSIYANGSSRRYVAGEIFVTPPNTKKAIYAHTDAVFMTVHKLPDADERDLDKIEAQLIDDEDVPALFDVHNKLRDPALADSRKFLDGGAEV